MFFLIIISVLYVLLIVSFLIGFDRLLNFKCNSSKPVTHFSIIIPFRNEMDNIPALSQSLEALNYSKDYFEVLWVNDNSTDDSVVVLSPYLNKNNNWRLINSIRNTGSPKKDAINTAINLANYSWVLTTDADCEVSKTWLHTYNAFILNNSTLKMVAGPVIYKVDKSSFLQNFQQLDFMSLIGSTIGSFGINKPFMCNGANLCYKKDAFFAVNGFEGNDSIASGDDVFLLEKMRTNYPTQVAYLKSKEAVVVTQPEYSFKNLVNQRIRWASKTSATNNWFAKIVGILVLLMNVSVVFSLISLRDFTNFNTIFVFILCSKFCIDFVLLLKTHRFFDQKINLKFYVLSFFIYPIFIMYIVILSFFKKYNWKGRVFDK